MKRSLTFGQYLSVASMLFGLFFGAGNMIFPVSMGQMAGNQVWGAISGFLITGVGLPLFGVIALGVSQCEGLAPFSRKIGPRYGTLFTCLLYLTIGPFFAIPRCATVPFSISIEPLVREPERVSLILGLFSLAFFLIVLWFSLRPSKILVWVGKILNPVFLLLLSILILTSMISPLGQIGAITPAPAYASGSFMNGFLEGYNTMDALASLAFGIIVVSVIRDLGVEKPGDIAMCTVKSGLLSSVLMATIYILVTLIGTQSRGVFDTAPNGGIALAQISRHYYGGFGLAILGATVTLACLKTSVGLITSCGETFASMFPGFLSYRKWAILFCIVSFLIANLGLDTIIQFSLPVLMFLYPLAITLIFLGVTGHLFGNARCVYVCTTAGAILPALLDFFKALPVGLQNLLGLESVLSLAKRLLPLFSLGLGWLLPSTVGFLIGLLLHRLRVDKSAPA